jgi:uncharacterized membrane protein YfcA
MGRTQVGRAVSGLGGLLLCSSLAVAASPPPVQAPHADLECVACHVEGPGSPPSCTNGGCHATEAAAFHSSQHDRTHLKGAAAGPSCADCHGGHSPRNPMATACERRLDSGCVACHPTDSGERLPGAIPGPAGLVDSIHTQARDRAGCAQAPMSCFSCHGSHTILPSSDPASPVARMRIAETCGKCHPAILNRYVKSSHAKGVASGSALAPTCTSCHGAHRVLGAAAGGSPTSAALVELTCGECHEDPAVSRAANLQEGVVESYERTFHGMAYDHGITDVATCSSCHRAHEVLPASDPAAWTSSARIKSTCTVCHPSVDDAMIAAASHPSEWPGFGAAISGLRIYFPVAGTSLNPLLVSGMGAVVGFLSGLFGVGGGFLMTPLLIFIGIPAAVAAATDAAQITAGASSGALSHSRLGNVDFKMGAIIVVGGWTGGYVGVRLVALLRHLGNFDFFLKLVYVLVLGFIGISMLIEGIRTLRGTTASREFGGPRSSGLLDHLPFQMHFPKCGLQVSILLPLGAGFLVGVLAAFLGVGGGFIMLPVMIYVIGIPTRVAVGTDLFQIVLTSSNVALQQAMVNHTVDILLAIALFLGSTIGAQFGVRASRHLRGEQIRVFLALIVLVVMGTLLYQLLVTPADLIDFARSGGGH